MNLLLLTLSLLTLTAPSAARVAKRQMTACQYTCFIDMCQPRCGFFPSTVVDQMCIDSCQITCGMDCDKRQADEDYHDEITGKKPKDF